MELSLSVAYYYEYDKFPYYSIQIQLKSNNTGALLDQRDEKLFQLQDCANRYQEKKVIILISNLGGFKVKSTEQDK